MQASFSGTIQSPGFSLGAMIIKLEAEERERGGGWEQEKCQNFGMIKNSHYLQSDICNMV